MPSPIQFTEDNLFFIQLPDKMPFVSAGADPVTKDPVTKDFVAKDDKNHQEKANSFMHPEVSDVIVE